MAELPDRNCRKKVRSPGRPIVPTVNRDTSEYERSIYFKMSFSDDFELMVFMLIDFLSPLNMVNDAGSICNL